MWCSTTSDRRATIHHCAGTRNRSVRTTRSIIPDASSASKAVLSSPAVVSRSIWSSSPVRREPTSISSSAWDLEA